MEPNAATEFYLTFILWITYLPVLLYVYNMHVNHLLCYIRITRQNTMFMEFGAFCFDNVKVIVHGFEEIESTFVLPENQ